MTRRLIAAIALIGALLNARMAVQATPQVPQSPEELIQALGWFPAAVPATDASSPMEQHRLEIYDRLWSHGPTAPTALCHGLGDPDVQVRRNIALFLGQPVVTGMTVGDRAS